MLSRRNFLKASAGSAGLLVTGCSSFNLLKKPVHHIVVIGGGFGGATAAKYMRKLDSNIRITLIEPNKNYLTCPGSNWVLGGIKSLDSLAFGYQSLAKNHAINILHDFVKIIDPEKHHVKLSNGQNIHYDRLIVSPGIDFRWETIDGYDQTTTKTIPHAWKAGEQTLLLFRQLQAMRNGGTVIISAPPNPYRCPPGPYERASLIAYYLKKYKPRSKILILDPKLSFSKQSLFMAGWEEYYQYGTDNSMIEWISIPDNPVIQVNAKKKSLLTDFGDQFKADVLNIIPAQKAGNIAYQSGLTDSSGWCPVNHASCESTLLPDIHVIGDAAKYSPLPKSAFAASSEAKVCAYAVVNRLKNQVLVEPTWINTCYSLITPEHGISVAMVYKLNNIGAVTKVKGSGGVTDTTDRNNVNLEAKFARHWYSSITEDTFL